ncbi:hypothetical protein GALMADRAFT_206828 [Galerina marginata CBS 339.88]|uniref:Uncharacterized protein n=1 Tax=Galerina marginata (strain CBS 339.88) TaxID=685588 RepID=A0A067TTF4_GALM3|nr:hypothetical protein GALMADRAFT_206828 [Galerina marginata CBS 339.88]
MRKVSKKKSKKLERNGEPNTAHGSPSREWGDFMSADRTRNEIYYFSELGGRTTSVNGTLQSTVGSVAFKGQLTVESGGLATDAVAWKNRDAKIKQAPAFIFQPDVDAER